MIERHLHNQWIDFLVTEPSDMKERGWAELGFRSHQWGRLCGPSILCACSYR